MVRFVIGPVVAAVIPRRPAGAATRRHLATARSCDKRSRSREELRSRTSVDD